MSERVRSLVFLTAIVMLGVLLASLVSTQPAQVDRAEEVGSRIKCPVCQGESIADSPAQMAEDMMALVEERVSQGASDEEIITELLASYSGAVLIDPPVAGATLLLWLAPGAALIAGVAVILWWRAHPDPVRPAPGAVPKSRARALVGGLVLVLAFAGIVVAANASLQARPGPASGVAGLEGQDLSQVSNETMEAVIRSNPDLPAITGMRLALAERYLEEGDFRSAFPHYLAVAEDPGAADEEVVAALTRLAWMTYQGNGEVETAIRLLDQALAIEPDAAATRYLLAEVRWCGAGDQGSARALLEGLAADPGLPGEFRAAVSSDLEAMTRGEGCG